MRIRKTAMTDLETVMAIYDKARLFMQETGNPTQWVDGYPSRELILNDIQNGNSYVCINEGLIAGVFAFMQHTEPAYLRIYEGAWLNDELYGVIHRIASAGFVKGVAAFCFDWCLNECKNLKIDTHRNNIVMQKALLKSNFAKCGIIYLEDGAERIAFQKVLR